MNTGTSSESSQSAGTADRPADVLRREGHATFEAVSGEETVVKIRRMHESNLPCLPRSVDSRTHSYAATVTRWLGPHGGAADAQQAPTWNLAAQEATYHDPVGETITAQITFDNEAETPKIEI